MPDRCQLAKQRDALGGFTLIELLVVVSIIALLIAMLMPLLGRSAEAARPTQCASNQGQLITAATAYAVERDRDFPDLLSAGGHITWIDEQSYQDLGGYIVPDAAGRLEVRHHQFYCPNRFDDWKLHGSGNNARVRTGYEVLLGRWQHPLFKRNDRYKNPGLAWRSTLSLDLPEPGTILEGGPENTDGNQDIGLLLADINEEGTLLPPVTSVAHSPRGYAQRNAPAGSIDPGQLEAEGGNLGFIDGSVVWRRFSDMNAHNNHQDRTNVLAWW